MFNAFICVVTVINTKIRTKKPCKNLQGLKIKLPKTGISERKPCRKSDSSRFKIDITDKI